MTTLTMLEFSVWALVIPANLGNQPTWWKLITNAMVALAAIGFAIAEGAIDGYPVGWLFVALMYAYSSGDHYWKIFHEEADIESKWAWRRWQEAEYEKKREAWWRTWGDGPIPTSTAGKEVRQ